MNEVVNYMLEVVFGIFIISVFIKLLLGIDLLAGIQSIWSKIIYGKQKDTTHEDNEQE